LELWHFIPLQIEGEGIPYAIREGGNYMNRTPSRSSNESDSFSDLISEVGGIRMEERPALSGSPSRRRLPDSPQVLAIFSNPLPYPQPATGGAPGDVGRGRGRRGGRGGGRGTRGARGGGGRGGYGDVVHAVGVHGGERNGQSNERRGGCRMNYFHNIDCDLIT
ncbi:hypothetical protein PMAYCL1PPCAC_28779, partial [Pristionchus mayeri]